MSSREAEDRSEKDRHADLWKSLEELQVFLVSIVVFSLPCLHQSGRFAAAPLFPYDLVPHDLKRPSIEPPLPEIIVRCERKVVSVGRRGSVVCASPGSSGK